MKTEKEIDELRAMHENMYRQTYEKFKQNEENKLNPVDDEEQFEIYVQNQISESILKVLEWIKS